MIATEWSGEYAFQDIHIKIRLDRLDRDQGNNIQVVDYKTGSYYINRLWDARLEEVQLPLYYLALSQSHTQPIAMMIIQLDLKESKCLGIAQNPLFALSEPPMPWEDLKPYWEEKITLLANEYRQGLAIVSPNRGDVTCQYCDCASFCRRRLSA